MNLRRVRRYEWTSALLGATLLAVMFLDWFRTRGARPDHAANAWQAFGVIDLVLALAAVMSIALVAATAAQRAAAIAQALAALTVEVGAIATVLVLYRVLSVPAIVQAGSEAHVTRELGLWIGLATCLGLVLSAWRSMSDERFPARSPQREVPVLSLPRTDGEPRASG